jgi:hypothetical protein
MPDTSFTSAEQAIKEVKEQVRIIVERFANRVGNLLVAETVKVLDENKKNASGELRKSITYETSIFGTFIKIVVFSPLDYAFYAHEGRAPGGVPPIYKIRDWVRLKGIAGRYSVKSPILGRRVTISGKDMSRLGLHGNRLGNRMDQYWQDTQAATAIAFAIAKHGTKGFKFFDFALRQALPKIERDYRAMMA